MKAIFSAFFWIAIGLGVAFHFTPQASINNISAPNWADIVSAIIAFLGLSLALITYANWHTAKIKEDAYNSVKRYASLLAEVEDIVIDIHFKVSGIVPSDSNMIPTKEDAIAVINELMSSFGNVSTTIKKLHTARSELPFWGASLKPDAEIIHTNLMSKITNYATFHFELVGLLNAYYHNQVPDLPVIAKYEQTHICVNEMFLIFTERKKSRIQNLFNFG